MENTIQFIQVTPEHLTDMITKGVLAIMNPPKEQEELLTREETAKLLKVTKETVDSLQKKGKITQYGLGSLIRYKRSELLESLVVVKQKA